MNPAIKQIKQNARQVAKQLTNEPLEILKTASRQVSGEILSENTNAKNINTKSDDMLQQEREYKKQVAEQDGRRLQVLQTEILDIQRQKKFKELLSRIQNNEDVPIEDFQELSSEQREVLKAHLESIKNRQLQELNQLQSLPEPILKKGRQMRGGQKQSAQKQTTRVEKPVPPSG
jgi:hypothetical protein